MTFAPLPVGHEEESPEREEDLSVLARFEPRRHQRPVVGHEPQPAPASYITGMPGRNFS